MLRSRLRCLSGLAVVVLLGCAGITDSFWQSSGGDDATSFELTVLTESLDVTYGDRATAALELRLSDQAEPSLSRNVGSISLTVESGLPAGSKPQFGLQEVELGPSRTSQVVFLNFETGDDAGIAPGSHDVTVRASDGETTRRATFRLNLTELFGGASGGISVEFMDDGKTFRGDMGRVYDFPVEVCDLRTEPSIQLTSVELGALPVWGFDISFPTSQTFLGAGECETFSMRTELLGYWNQSVNFTVQATADGFAKQSVSGTVRFEFFGAF